MNNILPFDINLTCPQKFTIYSVNNTGDLYFSKVFKEECEKVHVYRKYISSKSVGYSRGFYKDIICKDNFVQTTVSFSGNTTDSSQLILNLFAPNHLSPLGVVECNGLELNNYLPEKYITIDEADRKSDDKYKIEYYKFPVQNYPIIYCGIAKCDSNDKPTITHITNDPKLIAEDVCPIFMPIIFGLCGSFSIVFVYLTIMPSHDKKEKEQ